MAEKPLVKAGLGIMKVGCAITLLVPLLAIVFAAIIGSAPKDPVAVAKKEAECKALLQCWGDKHLLAAQQVCREKIEQTAKFDARWTTGTFEPIFAGHRWQRKDAATLTYMGDSVEFQTPLGTWFRHRYQCDFDPATKAVLDVRVMQGRMPASWLP